MKVGGWNVRAVETGTMRLDGGAMFGNVPKVLWQREHAADEKNRILLSLRCLLLEGEDRRVLVDVGMGEKWNDKLGEIYSVETVHGGARGALEGMDVDPDTVTDVVLTHLHFDHAGGVSEIGDDGNLQLSFPGARHWVQRRNLEHARSPGPRERASYLAENIDPLMKGDLNVIDGSQELWSGVSVQTSDGHTRGLQVVVVEGSGSGVVFPADLIPTASHIRLPFTMGYDNAAAQVIEEKEALLRQCVDRNWAVVFEHDPNVEAARVGLEDGQFSVVDTVVLG